MLNAALRALPIVPEHDVICRWSGTGSVMADGELSSCLVLILVFSWFSLLPGNSVSGIATIWLILQTILSSLANSCPNVQPSPMSTVSWSTSVSYKVRRQFLWCPRRVTVITTGYYVQLSTHQNSERVKRAAARP